MKVRIYAGGLDATLHARILPLVEALKSYGVKCELISPTNWRAFVKEPLDKCLSIVLTYPFKKYLSSVKSAPHVVIMGRVSSPQIWLLQKLYKSKGVKVVFDLDDALFLPTSRLLGNVNIRSPMFSYLEKVIKDSDFVTVNSHYLAQYAKVINSKVGILHDPVDIDIFTPSVKENHTKITIGWEGNPRAHYDNLAVLREPLKKLIRKYDIRFKMVSCLGDLRVKQMFRELEKFLEIDYGLNYWVPLAKLPELMSDFEIMVAPLQDTSWYHGKSALRVGLGMAVGIPVVASPVGEQRYVVRHGLNGFLAKNEEEWYQYLKTLVEDSKLRGKMGKHGRETAERELSLQVCGKRLFGVLAGLVQHAT